MEDSVGVTKRADATALNPEAFVRDVVLENPAAARVFETFGIDYCCGGDRSLVQACRAAGRSAEEVGAALRELDSAPSETNWRGASLTELARHIVDKHHAFTRAEIVRLKALIAKVASVHIKGHPELDDLRLIFEELSAELIEHMTKEEEMLFPYIANMEEAARFKRRPPAPMFGTVQNPVAAMIMEHEAAGQALEKMRKITKGYTVPPNGCASYQALYQALPDFAADLHQHIHLENNILFPRSVELENSFG